MKNRFFKSYQKIIYKMFIFSMGAIIFLKKTKAVVASQEYYRNSNMNYINSMGGVPHIVSPVQNKNITENLLDLTYIGLAAFLLPITIFVIFILIYYSKNERKNSQSTKEKL